MEALTFSLTRLPRNSGAHTQQTHARTPYFWHHLRLWSAVVAACLPWHGAKHRRHLSPWLVRLHNRFAGEPTNVINMIFNYSYDGISGRHIHIYFCLLVFSCTSQAAAPYPPTHPTHLNILKGIFLLLSITLIDVFFLPNLNHLLDGAVDHTASSG